MKNKNLTVTILGGTTAFLVVKIWLKYNSASIEEIDQIWIAAMEILKIISIPAIVIFIAMITRKIRE